MPRHAGQDAGARQRSRAGSAACSSTTTSSSTARPPRWSSARSSSPTRTPRPRRCCRSPPTASATSRGPVGAFFMGHIGDRHGRKRVLVLTVGLMGTATFLVGCLPTYDDIGIWAPVLLVALRLLQGFSASGEQSGANSLSLEHAPERPARVLHELHARRHAGRPGDRDRCLPPDRRDARGPAPELGLARPVLAQRDRRDLRPADPPPASRSRPRSSARWPRTPAASPSPPCCATTGRGVLRVVLAALALDRQHDLRRLRAELRRRHQRARPDDDAVGRDRDQRRRAGAIPLWAILADRIGRKPVLHLRRDRQRRC